MRRLLALLLAAVSAAWAGEPVRITILHTNDLHGQLEPLPPSPISPVLRNRPAGGFAHLATMVRALRREAEERRASLLLLDAGDLFQGTPIGNETRGDAVIDAMNVLGYDAAAVGNHEFDYGVENLLRLAGRARFPLLCANASRRDAPLPGIRAYVVLAPPRVPCRVAIVGLLTPQTPYQTSTRLGRTIAFADPAATARALRNEIDADLFLLLTHLGREDDLVLAEAVPGVALIVGGHSHTAMFKRGAGAAVVQTHGKGISLGRVDLDVDPEGWVVRRVHAELLPVDPGAVEPDAQVSEVIRRHGEALSGKLKERVGRLAGPARRGRGEEASAAGNWLADVIRQAGEAEIGFMNKGGVRCDLEAGDVTFEDVYRIMPFDNTVVSMDLTGAQVRALVGRSFVSGGFPGLDWSGLLVEAEREGEELRPTGLIVGDRPLDDSRTYRVATNSFLAAGGDDYGPFRDGRKVRTTGLLLRDAIAADLRARSPLTPPAEARLRVRAGVR
ncbi:MAG: bifunctional metallophosphatase/5'-nucleotidase [Planctomycetaceae bacterium]